MARYKRSLAAQRGSGDSFAIIGIVVLCTVISVALIILNWVKETKDARIAGDYERTQGHRSNVKRDVRGYQVIY